MDLDLDVPGAQLEDVVPAKRGHDGQGPKQPARKKANTRQQQQQQQSAHPQDQPSRAAPSKLRLRHEVLKLLSAEDIVQDDTPLLAAAAAAAAATASEPPARRSQKQRPANSRRKSAPATAAAGDSLQQTAFLQQGRAPQDAAMASPSSLPAGAGAAALATLRLRSTSSGLDAPAVAAAGLLALAAAAGSCSPCSSPLSAGTGQPPPDLQAAAAAAAGRKLAPAQAAAGPHDADGAAAEALIACAFPPPMTATAALTAAFPAAAKEDSTATGTGAGAASAQRPAAAAVNKPEDITAGTLCVADVGTFMGHRMFKTPFACWASWLKEAGPCSDTVLTTQVSELLPTLSAFLLHLRAQVASKARGEPGLAAWTARGYMCYVKLVLEKLQKQQPGADYKQLLRKATTATNEFEQQARHGRSFEASPPPSPKAASSSRSGNKAAAAAAVAAAAAGGGGGGSVQGSKAVKSRLPPRKPAAPGVMSTLRPRKAQPGGAAEEAEVAPEQQPQQPQQMQDVAPPAAAGAIGSGGRRKLRLRLRRGTSAAAADGVPGTASAAQGMRGAVAGPAAEGMVLGLLGPVSPAGGAASSVGDGDLQAVSAGQAASDAPMQDSQPALQQTVGGACTASSREELLQTLQAYAAEVEAVANLPELPGTADAPTAAAGAADNDDACMAAEELLAAVQEELDRAAGQQVSGDSAGPAQVDVHDSLMLRQEEQQEPDGMGQHSPEQGAGAAGQAAEDACADDTAAGADVRVSAASPVQVSEPAAADADCLHANTADTAAADKAQPGVGASPPAAVSDAVVPGQAGIAFVSLSGLQQQVQGCEAGMQLLWDVAHAQASTDSSDVEASQQDAADLLLRCSNADTLQACQQQCLEAAEEADVAGQAQTLEVVGGLMQLLQQPAVQQLLGEQQHRQRLRDVTAVYEAMLQAAAGASDGESPEPSSPEASRGFSQAPAAVPMACSTLG